VTWLNSLPYSDSDRDFLSEMQQSAADFQTHTLATANAVYDADVVSYERLLALTRVCEQFAAYAAQADGGGGEWQVNLDSDDDHFEATIPLPRRRMDAMGGAPDTAENMADDDDDVDDNEDDGGRREPPSSNVSRERPPLPSDAVHADDDSPDDNDDDDVDDKDNDAGESAAANNSGRPTQHYPASIVMRNTRLKAGTWLQWIMVQWQGCSVAEATWENDYAFYQQHYPEMLATYNNGRVPKRIVGAKLWYHPVTGGRHYKVQWQGSTYTTMERDIDVEGDQAFTSLLADFRKRHRRNESTRTQLPQTGVGSEGQRRPGRAWYNDIQWTDDTETRSNRYCSAWSSSELSAGGRITPTPRRTNNNVERLSHELSLIRLYGVW
jgi:hypothetical protein